MIMLQTKLCGNVNICRLEWRIFIEDIDDWWLIFVIDLFIDIDIDIFIDIDIGIDIDIDIGIDVNFDDRWLITRKTAW